MDTGKAILVVCLTLVIVLAFNAAIYLSVTRGKSGDRNVGSIELLRRAASRARSPWEKEDADLAELRRLASILSQNQTDDQEEA